MVPKECIQSLIFCANRLILSCQLKNFSKNIKKKKIFCLENFIHSNGFLASKIFLFPLKMTSFFKLLQEFNYKKVNQISLKNLEKRKYVFPTLNYCWDGIRKYFLSSNDFNPKQIGQMIFTEGMILQISHPMIKKISDCEFLNNKKTGPIRSIFTIAKQKKNSKKVFLEKINKYLINYQEAKIAVFKIHSNDENLEVKCCLVVYFVGKMVGRFAVGRNISILGVIKRRNVNSFSNYKKNPEIDFLLETVFVVAHKKKTIKDKLHNNLNLPLLDFGHFWQDSEIRGSSFLTRNCIFQIFVPEKGISAFSKFVFLLSLIGGCIQTNLNKKEIRGACNCCIIQKSERGKKFFLKTFQHFWIDSIDLNFQKIENFSQSPSVSTKSFYLEVRSNLLSNSSMIFFDNYRFGDKKNQAFFKSILKKFELKFYDSKKIFTIKTLGASFAIVDVWNIPEIRLTTKNGFSSKKRAFLKKNKKNSTKFLNFFDTFFAIRNKNFTSKKRNLFFFLFKTTSIWLNSLHFFFSNKKGSRKWLINSLNSFLVFVKAFSNPILGKKAEIFLIKWYSKKLMCASNHVKNIIIFEKLVRISQAIGRFLWKETIVVQDCLTGLFVLNNFFFLIQKTEYFKEHFGFFFLDTSLIKFNKNFQNELAQQILYSSSDDLSLAGGNVIKKPKKV